MPHRPDWSTRALKDAMVQVATIAFGDLGWTDALVERHGFTAKRSARGRIDVQDLLAYPKLRSYLQQRYGVSPYEAVRWWRSLPDTEDVPIKERRAAQQSYRHYVLMDITFHFLEDVVRHRD